MTRDQAARLAADRGTFSDDDIEVDADALVTHLDEPDSGVEGSAWVQAWVFVPSEAIELVLTRHA